MHVENPIEIGLLNIQSFLFGPLINTHLLYEAEIEKLCIVRSFGCLVRIWMKIIAGKFYTLKAIGNPFFIRAAIYIARSFVSKKQYSSSRMPAPFAF